LAAAAAAAPPTHILATSCRHFAFGWLTDAGVAAIALILRCVWTNPPL
jgi:hypothetical protein